MEINTLIEFLPYQKLVLNKSSPPRNEHILCLEKWRSLLHKIKLIKVCPTKHIGYGDFSIKTSSKPVQFIINGEATQKMPFLSNQHYVKINECDLEKKIIKAEGSIAPSTKAILHHLIYENISESKVIFQLSHSQIWQYLKKDQKSIIACTKDLHYLKEFKVNLKNNGNQIIIHKDIKDFITIIGTNADEVGRHCLELYRKIPTWN